MWVYPPVTLVNIFFIQHFMSFHTFTYLLGSVILVFLGVLFFVQLFNSYDHENLLRFPAFWLVSGIIFNYIASTAFTGVVNYLATLPFSVRKQLINLLSFANSIVYVLYIIAFLCRLNSRKYMSSSSQQC
jgi:hypothetical protein